MSKTKYGAKKERQWFQPSVDFGNDLNAKKPRIDSEKELCAKDSFNKSKNSQNASKEILVENWTDKFKPKDIPDLAVNSKKVQEVQDWLVRALENGACPNCMLLVTGPTGCGKTITLEVLAKNIGVTISEWVNPIDIEYVRDLGPNSYTFQEKQSDKFSEFLLKASRFPSLLSSSPSRRIIVVKDFPNSFLRDATEFVNILQKYKDRGKSPIIFICTDTRDGGLNMIWNLFPPNVQEKFNIDHISFNPIATTGMKQALKRIVGLADRMNSSLKIPDQDCVDSIIDSSMGDLRSAVNNLHFASLKGNFTLEVTSKTVKDNKGKRNKKSKEKRQKISTIGKDENVTIMHGVGRVLNPKLTEKLTAKDHQRFTHPPETIVDCFQTQPVQFVGYVHENYLPHFSDIHYVERATDALSDADCFMNEWREKDGKIYGLTVAVAGLMIANKSPVSSWHPIKAPKKNTIVYPTLQEIPLLERDQMICGKVLATDFKGFCKIIHDGSAGEDDSLIEDYVISE